MNASPITIASMAGERPQFNEPGRWAATADRLPFTHTVELRYGAVLGQFDGLADAENAALEFSAGDRSAVIISGFSAPQPDRVEQKSFVVYDADFAELTRPWNPMKHPEVVRKGDYHHGMVKTFGYESKWSSTNEGAPQFIVDDDTVFDIKTLDERS